MNHTGTILIRKILHGNGQRSFGFQGGLGFFHGLSRYRPSPASSCEFFWTNLLFPYPQSCAADKSCRLMVIKDGMSYTTKDILDQWFRCFRVSTPRCLSTKRLALCEICLTHISRSEPAERH